MAPECNAYLCYMFKKKKKTHKLFSTMKENTICTAAYDTMEDHFKKTLPQMMRLQFFPFFTMMSVLWD